MSNQTINAACNTIWLGIKNGDYPTQEGVFNAVCRVFGMESLEVEDKIQAITAKCDEQGREIERLCSELRIIATGIPLGKFSDNELLASLREQAFKALGGDSNE